VAARLDTGDPWVVERLRGKARVLLLATPVDAEAGTLPVKPDFVPLVHEGGLHLAGGPGGPEGVAGEPFVFGVNPPPPSQVKTLSLLTPGGATVSVPVVHSTGAARVRIDETSEAGIYRLTLSDPPGGFAYGSVVGDGRESDPAPLEPA